MDGVERNPTPGFRGPKGAFGATESHLQCLRESQADGIETVLILEDDCLPHKDFWDLWSTITVPDNWNMIFLGAIQMNWYGIKTMNPNVYKAHNTLSAHSYITTKTYIPSILQEASIRRIPIDEVFVRLQNRHPSYVITPNLFINHVDESFVRVRNTWSIQNQRRTFRWKVDDYDIEKTPLTFKA
jgi:GR25 family glycosyltransferase involved in LPS biosynthesis